MELQYNKDQYETIINQKNDIIKANEKKFIDYSTVSDKTIKEYEKELAKYQDPPFYKRKSTWFLVGAIVGILITGFISGGK